MVCNHVMGTFQDLDPSGAGTSSGTRRGTVLLAQYLLVTRMGPCEQGSQVTHSSSRPATLTGSVIDSSNGQKHRLLADSFFLLLTTPVHLRAPATAGPARPRARLPRVLTAINRFRHEPPAVFCTTRSHRAGKLFIPERTGDSSSRAARTAAIPQEPQV